MVRITQTLPPRCNTAVHIGALLQTSQRPSRNRNWIIHHMPKVVNAATSFHEKVLWTGALGARNGDYGTSNTDALRGPPGVVGASDSENSSPCNRSDYAAWPPRVGLRPPCAPCLVRILGSDNTSCSTLRGSCLRRGHRRLLFPGRLVALIARRSGPPQESRPPATPEDRLPNDEP